MNASSLMHRVTQHRNRYAQATMTVITLGALIGGGVAASGVFTPDPDASIRNDSARIKKETESFRTQRDQQYRTVVRDASHVDQDRMERECTKGTELIRSVVRMSASSKTTKEAQEHLVATHPELGPQSRVVSEFVPTFLTLNGGESGSGKTVHVADLNCDVTAVAGLDYEYTITSTLTTASPTAHAEVKGDALLTQFSSYGDGSLGDVTMWRSPEKNLDGNTPTPSDR